METYGIILVGILFPVFAIAFTVGLQVFGEFAKAYRNKLLKDIERYSKKS